jgi:hypothetical protein
MGVRTGSGITHTCLQPMGSQLPTVAPMLLPTLRRCGITLNNDLDTFYKSKGIQSETTVAYTPQQNGKAERLNRTLLDKARPMLAEYNLPKHLWAEAILTANYLRNRSPTSAQDVTPYEMLHGTKPDLSHLRIFGARAYAHIPTALRSKLDAVSEPGRFIGYPTNTKGYKILLDNGSIVISRDVTFNEASSNLPKPILPETISLIDNDDTGDTESVGAPAEPEDPPSPPIALRRTAVHACLPSRVLAASCIFTSARWGCAGPGFDSRAPLA